MKYTYQDYKNKLDDVFNKYANKSAIVSLNSDDTQTILHYSELLDIANNIGKSLAELGLKRADRVAVVSPHTPYAAVLNLSLAYLGYTAVLLDSSLIKDEINRLLDYSDVSAVFTTAQMYKNLNTSLLVDIPILKICDDFTYDLFSNSIKQGNKAPTEPTNESVVAVIFSSGTTDTMKGVQITYSSIIQAHEYMVKYTNLNSAVSFLNVLPSNHIAGYSSSASVFLSGGEMGFTVDLSPLGLAHAFLSYNPSNFIMVPQVYEIIMRKIQSAIDGKSFFVRLYAKSALLLSKYMRKTTGIKLRFLTKPIWKAALGRNMKICGCGTAPCSSEVMSFYLNLGIDFVNVYGSTETGFPITATNCNDKYVNYGAGNVLQFSEIEIRIFNPDKDGIGEIRVKSPLMMMGYFKDPERTRDSFDENGFFKTGDYGYVDKKGNLFVTGRIKEAILLRSGKKISPSGIDETYRKICEGVSVASVGIPCKDNTYDEIHLFVQKKGLNSDEVQRAVEQIREYSSNANPMYKVSSIHLIEEFPITSSGKIKRYLLKEMIVANETTIDENKKSGFYVNSPSEQVYEIISRLNPNGVEVLDSSLSLKKDLGFDSLSLFELCVEIESATGINVTDKMQGEPTVGNIVKMLDKKDGSSHASTYDIDRFPLPKRDKDLKFIRQFQSITQMLWNFEIIGAENIPSVTKLILCPNHESYLDAMWIASALYKNNFDVKALYSLAAEHLMNRRLMKKAFVALGGIPVDRMGNTAPAIERALQCLNNDKCLMIIHPEGTRTRSGELGEFKQGAAMMSIESGVQILPVCINGAYKIFPPYRKLPRLFNWKHFRRYTLQIKFGESIDPAGKTAEEITNEIKQQIVEMKDGSEG